MAYNNGFPATYPQMYYPQPYQLQPVQQSMPAVPQPVPQTPQTVANGIIWVQGESGAKSHVVAPNTTVALWDSETQRIFLKSADAAGMPSMKILSYTIEETPNIAAPVQRVVGGPATVGEYAGKAEHDALKAEMAGFRGDIDAIRAELDSFRGDLYGVAGKKPTVKKKEASDDE